MPSPLARRYVYQEKRGDVSVEKLEFRRATAPGV